MTRLRRERRNDKAAIMSVEMIKETVRVDRVALRHALVIKSSHSLIRLAKKFQSHPFDAYLRQNHIQLAKSSQNHTLGRKTLHPHRIIVPSLSERPPQTGAVTAEKTLHVPVAATLNQLLEFTLLRLPPQIRRGVATEVIPRGSFG